MNEFKIGDIVICIDNTEEKDSITIGKKYKIKLVSIDEKYICIKNDYGKETYYNNSYFEKYDEDKNENNNEYNIITALDLPIGSEFNACDEKGCVINRYKIKVVKSEEKDIADKRLIWVDNCKYIEPVRIDNYTNKIVLKLIHKEELDFFKAIKLIKQGKRVTNEFILENECTSQEYFYLDSDNNISYSDGEFSINEDEINGKWYEV